MSKRKYGWVWKTNKEGSHWSDPFTTKEQAIEEGIKTIREYYSTQSLLFGKDGVYKTDNIIVGRSKKLDPQHYIETELNYFLENMDCVAPDNGFPFDDQIFDVHNKKQAQKELSQRLKGWARKWCYSDYFDVIDKEEIRIPL